MTNARFRTNDSIIRFLLGLALLAALALNLAGLDGTFLCDDFSHLGLIAASSDRGALGAWVAARFFHGLDNGNFAYRPITFASYALDWIFYRADATGWHATNVALYFINAAAAGWLVRRWLRADAAAATQGTLIAAAAMVAFPFAGEIAFWPVGRFDLLAALFSLLYLHALPPAARTTAVAHALRVLWLLGALLSKESAMPLPVVASLVCIGAYFSGETRARRLGAAIVFAVRETVPTWIAFALYLVWRKYLFGSYWKVYPDSSPPHGFGELIDRIWIARHVVTANIGAHAVIWIVATTALAVLLTVAVWVSRRSWSGGPLGIAMLLCAAMYAIAPASGFPMSAPTGEGSRLLYLPWVYAMLAVALFTARVAIAQYAVAGLLAVMLYGEAQTLGKWHAAAREMARITRHVTDFAARVPAGGYALLFLPDHIGPVLFARNAQGGIVSRPTQPADYLARMAVMTEDGFEGWSKLLARMAETRSWGSTHADPMDAAALFCWNPARSAIVPLTSGAIERDPSPWRQEAMGRLVSAGCLAPR